MGIYRIYCLDGVGRIGLAEWLEAPDDEDAIEQAQDLKKGARKCEVWLNDRLIAALGTKELEKRAPNSGLGCDPAALDR